MGRGKDNIRYREMEVAEGTYIPDCDVCYPEQDPDEHIMPVRYDGTEVVLDENYPYLDDSFRYRFNHFMNATLLRLLVMHVNRLRYGLKVEGREKLRRNKALLRNGAITVCNHVYRWDLSCVLHAIRPHRTWFPIYGEHLRGKDAWFMRYLGGVPVPETRSGMRPFNEAFDEIHRRGEWIHVFPESCSWKHYVPIRPFHKGAFTMAYKYGMPLVPFVISYRERKGIFRWFDKADTPLMTVHVGDAIIPDLNRPRKEEVDRMLREAHAQMVTMAGIVKNPWPATLEP